MNISALIIISLTMAALAALSFLDLSLFIAAKFSKVDITLKEYISLRLRKINHKNLIRAMIMLTKGEINFDKPSLVSIEENNGSIMNVVHTMLVAKKAGVDFPLDLAIKGDKLGINMFEELKKSPDLKTGFSSLIKNINKSDNW